MPDTDSFSAVDFAEQFGVYGVYEVQFLWFCVVYPFNKPGDFSLFQPAAIVVIIDIISKPAVFIQTFWIMDKRKSR